MKKTAFPGMNPDLINKLRLLGVKKSSDYYKLSYKDQLNLVPEIKLGNVALDPLDPDYQCTELELPPNPEGGITTPIVDWTWRGLSADEDHVIDTRPWWGVPDQQVDTSSLHYAEQQYWYPDPAQGWKVFGYQFGGTGGQLGYLLMYNNYTGVMRLFVYLPKVEVHFFTELLCRISITDASFVETDIWSFPLQNVPPTVQQFDKASENSGGPKDGFLDIPHSITFTWPGKDQPYHELSAASSQGNGVWLRTEIPTLYDPRLYPSTQPFRDLKGCLSIFFPGFGSGTQITQDDRRKLRIRFYQVLTGQTDLYADLNMDLSGKGVPSSASGDGTLGAVKGAVLTSIAAASGASTALAFIGLTAGSGGAVALVAAAAAAGAYFGMTGNDNLPPEYRIMMLGTAEGTVSGTTVFVLPATTFDLNLTDTFIPEGPNPPIGWPQTYQRCDSVRFGLFGFRPHGKNPAYLSPDPRPSSIQVKWFAGDESSSYNVPYILISPIGYLQSAPWAEIDITEQTAQLEVTNFSDSIPHQNTVIVLSIPFSEQAEGEIISRENLGFLKK
jgi:hypothetical protein